jgi:hydrogenase-4 membrane subunit HyfE
MTIMTPLIGWALCGAVIGIGYSVTSQENTLIVHAIVAPIIFASLTLLYFRKVDHSSPFNTALTFTAIIITMDFFVSGLLIQGSLSMFSSILGTWIPFAEIFSATYLAGTFETRRVLLTTRAPVGLSR